MSPILVTLTSRSDSDFERSNVSLKENKPDGVNPNSNNIDYYVRKNEGKILWFSADCIGVESLRLCHGLCQILWYDTVSHDLLFYYQIGNKGFAGKLSSEIHIPKL